MESEVCAPSKAVQMSGCSVCCNDLDLGNSTCQKEIG